MRAAYAASVVLAAAKVALAQANNADSAKAIVDDIIRIYQNGSTPSSPGFIPGLFPADYYFWESGLAWDSLISYWAYTGDEAVVDTIRQGLMFQVGPNNDFMHPNQTRSLGNDDQSTWALAAMTAAEHGLPEDGVPWYELARNVFETQVVRWDEESCAGGFRWQIFTFNNGYTYKNALTQANFAQLGARLWRFTGNSTYLEWAERAVEWATNTGLIISSRDTPPAIYDGTETTLNCSQVNHIQWTINAGQFMSAFAYACNETCSDQWRELGRVSLATTTATFASNNSILTEVACAGEGRCNVDQLAFRAPLARALANARDMAGVLEQSSKDDAGAIVTASASGAVGQCSTENGCGSDWSVNEWDGTSGLGQDLSALEIILATFPRKELSTLNSTGSAPGSPSGSSGGNGTTGAGGASGGSGNGGDANAAAGGINSSLLLLVIAGLTTGLFMSL